MVQTLRIIGKEIEKSAQTERFFLMVIPVLRNKKHRYSGVFYEPSNETSY